MLRSGSSLLVILKRLGAAHHYERSPSTNCIKQSSLRIDGARKEKVPTEIGTFKLSSSTERNVVLGEDSEP